MMRKTIALVGILIFVAAGLAWSANVTVGAGGQHATVQAGVDAAGVNGTVTILDSAVYTEDVTIEAAEAGVTIQAAAGQRPTISALNQRAHATYQVFPILIATEPAYPYDRFGVSVQAPCTLVGLNIENTDGQTNHSPSFGDLAACAMIVHSPGVTVRDCTISGPTTGFGPGDWATVLVIAWGPTAADVVFENCDISGGEYALVNETFGRYNSQIPVPPGPFTTSTLRANSCMIHGSTAACFQIDAGIAYLTDCDIYDGTGDGVGVGGGMLVLDGCDIYNNANAGLYPDYNDSFALPGDWPVVYATDCMIYGNHGTGHDGNVRIDDGTVTIERSVIARPENTVAIYCDDDASGETAGSPCILNMDFCDVYSPGQDCFGADLNVQQHPIQITVTNSILVGRNGLLMQNSTYNVCSITYSDLYVTDTATSDVTVANNVTIEPQYLNPGGTRLRDFRYHNDNLNVGEANAEIGSQGRYQPPDPLGVRIQMWSLYR
jgi:hypothetical protein